MKSLTELNSGNGITVRERCCKQRTISNMITSGSRWLNSPTFVLLPKRDKQREVACQAIRLWLTWLDWKERFKERVLFFSYVVISDKIAYKLVSLSGYLPLYTAEIWTLSFLFVGWRGWRKSKRKCLFQWNRLERTCMIRYKLLIESFWPMQNFRFEKKGSAIVEDHLRLRWTKFCFDFFPEIEMFDS